MAEQLAGDLPRIAFIFGDAALAEHVRDAIAAHAEIAYAAPAGDFDAERLAQAQPSAALVNLDGGDWFDDLESRLDAAGIPVVFNDPEISRQLEGWDRARWLRHLAAKLRGSMDFDPPRPEPTAIAVDAPGAAPAADSEVGGPAQETVQATSADPEHTASATSPAADGNEVVPVAAAGPGAPVSAATRAAEMPLSPHEIETLTADFTATSGASVASAASWNPVSAQLASVAVSPQPAAVPPTPVAAPEDATLPSADAADPGDGLPAVAESQDPATELSGAEAAAEPDADMPVDDGAQDAGDPHAPDGPGADVAAAENAGDMDPLDVDTEALSAMIDARLAEPETAGSPDEGESWAALDATHSHASHPTEEPAMPADDPLPAATGAAADGELSAGESPAPDPDADVLDDLPSLDDWELIDPATEPAPVSADSPSRQAAPELPDSFSELTLVPLDPISQIHPDSDPIERWIDESENRAKAKRDGDKA